MLVQFFRTGKKLVHRFVYRRLCCGNEVFERFDAELVGVFVVGYESGVHEFFQVVDYCSSAQAGVLCNGVAGEFSTGLQLLEKGDEDAKARLVLVTQIEKTQRSSKPLEFFVDVARTGAFTFDDGYAREGHFVSFFGAVSFLEG